MASNATHLHHGDEFLVKIHKRLTGTLWYEEGTIVVSARRGVTFEEIVYAAGIPVHRVKALFYDIRPPPDNKEYMGNRVMTGGSLYLVYMHRYNVQ